MAARIAGTVYVVAVVVMCIRAGAPEQAWWWLGMVVFAVWIPSPVLGGLHFGRRLADARARITFAILVAIIAVIGFALQWHTLFIGPPDAQNALILVFVPLYQWFGILVGLPVAWAFGKASAVRRGNGD